MMRDAKFRVAVLGGGLSGLSAAYFLYRQSLGEERRVEIHVFDPSPRLGGVISTEREERFLLERGPESFIAAHPAARSLVSELELDGELLGSRDESGRTYVVSNGRLEPFPRDLGFPGPVRSASLLRCPLLSLRGRLRLGLEPLIPPARGEPTIRRFVERRLGREFTEKIAEPLLGAVYGGDIDRLSAPATLPSLFAMEQRHGSFWKASGRKRKEGRSTSGPRFLTFRDGMGRLPQRLGEVLEGVVFHRREPSVRLIASKPGWRIRGPGVDEVFDAVIPAAPAGAVADFLQPCLPEAAHLLTDLKYTNTTVVHLAYRRSDFSHPLDGFGFVVPCGEDVRIDACSWISTKFDGRAPKDMVLLRATLHDGRRPRFPTPDADLAEAVQREIASLLRISATPVFWRVFQTRNALPQMRIGNARKLSTFRELLRAHPALAVAGSCAGSLGIPGCIESGERAAREIREQVRSRTL